jgi:hypothetical protein
MAFLKNKLNSMIKKPKLHMIQIACQIKKVHCLNCIVNYNCGNQGRNSKIKPIVKFNCFDNLVTYFHSFKEKPKFSTMFNKQIAQ